MLTSNRKGVYILDNLIINRKLKKYTYNNIETNSTCYINITPDDIMSFGSMEWQDERYDNSWRKVWDGIPLPVERGYNTKFQKFVINSKLKLYSIFFKSKKSPIEYFKNIKTCIEEFDDIESKIQYLTKVEKSLRESGQEKMLNICFAQRKVLDYEKILKDSKFNRFITDENLVKFTLQCKRGLVMEYIDEFKRIIPQSVIDNKNLAEDLLVFDNYVVLHYDPTIKNISHAEKKDPILFGVIKNSKKLYFIDDWIDEKCDLTYEKIIKELDIDEKIV